MRFLIFALPILLVGCAYSSNACVLIPEPPKIRDPAYIVDNEPELTDWFLLIKKVRELHNCNSLNRGI